MHLAKIAYYSYCRALGWISFNDGHSFPPFHQQEPVIQEAWASAAAAVWHELIGTEDAIKTYVLDEAGKCD